MNLIIFFVTFSTFSATVHSMHPRLRHQIQTFYEGDFRTVMALYNKYTESRSYKVVNPCRRYKKIEVIIDPLEFTSIKSDVIMSLNTNMALTLDGESNFSIHAVMKCLVMKHNREVFEFFVLLLPDWAKTYTKGNTNYIPVYSYGPADQNWQWFAIKDVYDFQILKNTFRGIPQDRLRIPAELQYPELVPMITDSLEMSAYDAAEVVDWKFHFDNFDLLLNDKSSIQIPAITVIKLRNPTGLIRYAYMIMFRENPSVVYPPNPFRYLPGSETGIFRYVIYNTGKMSDGMWSFSLDINLVKPRKNTILIPPFVDQLRW